MCAMARSPERRCAMARFPEQNTADLMFVFYKSKTTCYEFGAVPKAIFKILFVFPFYLEDGHFL
jgi:hypothetical protein